ncbi:TsgA-like MFS transporter [Silvimonas terrae]|uniref:TsgA-like MFS transporter n=1 Tax=Silvimonas terrae TaxID=300266 RepID=A0A840RE75_9NEIS|nr:MFS transporter TsgA [Silvimonas terrae]MBB5191287.1 TsgA-like MFS transporter [Silvimonas terrae]
MDNARNRLRINMISWLSYFFTGSLVSTLGIVLFPVSQAFGKTPAFIGQMFTLMNIGLFLPIMVSGMLMRHVHLGTQLIVGSAISALTCAALFIFPANITAFGVGVFLIGAASGIMMAIGSYLVVRINDDAKARSANLIFTDFFFALAGVVLSLVLGYLFKHGASWLAMYGAMGILSVLMIILCLGVKFPIVKQTASDMPVSGTQEPWGIAAWILCFALFCFLLAEPVFTMWLPTWLKEQFGMAPDQAAYYITTYWTVKSIGLFVNQFTVRFIKLRTYLLASTVVGLFSLVLAANSAAPGLILVCAGLFGFCNSGLFSGLMSYGSLQVRNSPPTLTSALLTIGTIGTLVFSSLSAFVYSQWGLHWALNTATVAYVLLLVSLVAACITSKAEKLGVPVRIHGA